MALVAAGNSISFLQIKNEFGGAPTLAGSSGISFGRYRVQWSNTASGGSLTNMPLDTGIPQSGIVSFSDFHSKKLNVVVNFYDANSDAQNIKSRFKEGSGVITAIGGFQESIPDENNIIGSKVIADVNKRIGSRKSLLNPTDTSVCALITGDWTTLQELVIKVGISGTITGAGGNGGIGATAGNNAGGEGTPGTSAIGVSKIGLNLSIINDGVIRCGFGGGGGGRALGERRRSGKKSTVWVASAGGGGGGGAGFPVGLGETGGADATPNESDDGDDGDDGTQTAGGDGGAGGTDSGKGGHGGDTTPDGTNHEGANRGPDGDGNRDGGDRAKGGANGFSIITRAGGLPTITGSGEQIGQTKLNDPNIRN